VVEGVDAAPVGVVAAVEAAEPEGAELEGAGVGSAAKVTVMAKAGSCGGQPPLPPEPALPPELDLVELCSVTTPTPSIRRRR
jgi:hypothetical protein